MSDERLVEVMAEGMHNANHCPSDGPGTWQPEAAAALAALRDAGWLVVPKETVHPDYEAAARVFEEAGYANKGIRILLDRAVDEALG